MKISIDIVLLLDPYIADLSFKINREIVRKWGKKIIFWKHCIPHISILMWTIEVNQLKETIHDLQTIANESESFQLVIKWLSIKKGSSWENHYDFVIDKTEELRFLHQEIFDKFINKLSFDATLWTLYSNPEDPVLNEITLKWINNHQSKKDFTIFHPHIMLGIWWDARPKIEKEIWIMVSKIGIYQLWDFCTCRKELAIIQMKG